MNSEERSGTQADFGTWTRVVNQYGAGRRKGLENGLRMEGVKGSSK